MRRTALLLTIVMIVTMFAPWTNIFGAEAENKVKAGYIICQDYENAFNDVCKTVYPASAADYVSIKDGAIDIALAPSGTPKYSAVMATGEDIDFSTLPAEYVIDFDLNVINCSAPFVVGVSNPNLADKAAYLARIFPGTFADVKVTTSDSINTQTTYANPEVNEWYDFRIEINENNYNLETHNSNSASNGVFKIYYKKRTDTDFKELKPYTSGNFAEKCNYRPSGQNYGMVSTGDSNAGLFFKVAGDDFARACIQYKDEALAVSNSVTDAHYQVDNVRVFVPGLCLERAYFERNGIEQTTVPTGSVNGVVQLDNLSFEDKTAYVAVEAYNSNDDVIKTGAVETVIVAKECRKFFETATLDINGLSDLSKIKMTVWEMKDGSKVVIGEKIIYNKSVIVDNASDGNLSWMGYNWTGECVLPEYDNQFLYNTQPCPHDAIFVDDNGYLNFILPHSESENGKHHRVEVPRRAGSTDNQINLLKNYDIEFEMRILEENSNYVGFQMYDEDSRVYLVFDEDGITYQDDVTTHTVNITSGNEWVTWRGERRGDIFSLYMNGDLVVSYTLPKLASTNTRDGAIRFYATSYKKISTQMQLRSLYLHQYEDVVEMTPAHNENISAESDVVFKADVADNPEYIEYYVGNVCIGRGTAETDYAYTLTDANVGAYNASCRVVYADGTEKTAFNRTFTVGNTQEAFLTVPDSVNYGENPTVLVNNRNNLDISYAEFYADGDLIGTSSGETLSAELSGLSVGSASVYAKVYLNDGTYVCTNTEYINVKAAGNGTFDIKREYDLSYKTEGNGQVCVKDGYFELSMVHSDGMMTYITRDGAETHSAPDGTYRAVVSAGIADVYRDGQFAFSYYMPRCNDASAVTSSGVSDLTVNGSGVKAELFSHTFGNEREITAENINMGLFYSLEFDKKDSSDETILLYDGEYELSMEFDDEITVLAQPVTASSPVKQKLTDNVPVGYYRVTVYRGLAQIFVDNKFIASFRAPMVSHKTTLRRVMSKSGETTFTAIKNSDDVFYFEDDFQGDNERESAEHWYNIHGDVAATFENGAMNLSGTGTYLLDATAENPTLRWNMTLSMTEEEKEVSGGGSTGGNSCDSDSGSSAPTVTVVKSGEFAIAARYRNEYNNVKIKYDHNGGSWSVIETEKGASTTVATATKALDNNTAYDYILDIDKDKLTLECGGQKIFDGVQLTFLGNGKYGFSPVDYKGAVIDNLSYVGNGKVNTGVNYSWYTAAEMGGTAEYIKGFNGNAVMIQSTNKYETSNMGATWEKISEENAKMSTSGNMIHLQSGRFLIVSDWGEQSHASLYEADGTSVKSNVILQDADDKMADRNGMSGRLMQSRKVWGTSENAQPRVFYVTSEGAETNGTTRVYYSDDEGLSWTESKTVLSFDNMGEFYAGEADIVDMPDDRIRVWLRCNRGFLHYTDSYDGGETFSNVPTASQFITPSTAFSIERDPQAEETYYIIWEYDVTTAALEYIQQPRNRTAMAVSYDGMESWDYIMEMDDLGVYRTTSHMNSCIRVIDGIVYANNCYLDAIKYTDDRTIKTMVYVLDPSKINTTKRFTNAHIVFPDFSTVYDDSPSQAVLPKTDGTAMIYNNIVPCTVNEEGMVEASVLARAVSAEYVSTPNGVEFSIGDGTVSFIRGSKEYMINGVSYTASAVCLSEDGGYLNVKVCAQIFGKEYSETASSYLLMSATFSETTQGELENLVAGVPNSIRLCIEEFKNIENAVQLKAFFENYKVLLNLYTDFTDKSYENMYQAYVVVDMNTVTDYDSMMMVIGELVANEKGRADAFVAAINSASSTVDAEEIKLLMSETYGDLLSFVIDTSMISDSLALFKKMTGITYNNIAEIESAYKNAFIAQYNFENGNTNAVTVSSASQGFDVWNPISNNVFGGVSWENVNGENVATMSAYEGIIDERRVQVEEPFQNGKVYQQPGVFGENVVPTNVTVNNEEGKILFNGGVSAFGIKGSSVAESNTVVTVFDMTKPSDKVTATFSSGMKKAVVEIQGDSTSVGELPNELKNEEKLTYRAEMSMSTLTLLAKKSGAADTDYYVIGTMNLTNVTKTIWSVMFTTSNAVAEISNIGIYSAVSSVKYDINGFKLQDDIYYAVDGDEGHTMNDLAAVNGVLVGNATVNDEGILVLKRETGESNSVINIMKGNLLTGGFDRAEIDLRLSVDTDSRLYYYFCDNSYFRQGDGYLMPERFDTKSNGCTYKWTTDQYYDIKFITMVMGYDANGQARTSVSMYVKKAEDTEWICTAFDQPFTMGSKVYDPQIKFLNTIEGKASYFKKLSIKTYTRAEGTHEFINNGVTMPEVDYIYSFDYMRMDKAAPTVFSIGGEDYYQTFEIGQYRVTSDLTDAVKADMTIEEDKWYRFYGKVSMTEETPYVHDSSKITKNKISLYREDSDGNVVTVFENLPMVKSTGFNGLRFKMSNTFDAGIRLKNVRVYNGKALDVVNHVTNGNKTTVSVDFLNDDIQVTDDFIVIGGAYEGDVFTGAKIVDVTEDINAFGSKRIDVTELNAENDNTLFKIFAWKDAVSNIPLTGSVECGGASQLKQLQQIMVMLGMTE